jgi:AmmeMemoRadiSam system protein B/AmmeMemoRadiSam system protein A
LRFLFDTPFKAGVVGKKNPVWGMTMRKGATIALILCLNFLLPGMYDAAGDRGEVRAPVWSGKFYPANGPELLQTIDQLTRHVHVNAPTVTAQGTLKALIMPHAGYIYSGTTAAHAVHVLQNRTFDKIILIGPDHQLGLTNAALTSAVAWETPLGRIKVHKDYHALLRQPDLFRVIGISDDREHCLEVILPFLQVYLPEFELLPILLGPCDHRQIADAVGSLIDDRTLLVISGDLSHFLPYAQAVERDRTTIQAILDLKSEPVLDDANRTCGKHPIAVLLHLARNRQWQPVLLAYANSGDTAGDRERVVGYAAIAFFGESAMPSQKTTQIDQSQGQALLLLARNTLMERFNQQLPDEQKTLMESRLKDPVLQEHCGTFVTIKIDRQLRGCIGSLTGTESLVDGVRANAINAAFHDPRFRALRAEELDRIVIEVSVLTKPEPLAYRDPEDLVAKLRPTIDGVTIRKGSAGATFLPQVWNQLPITEEFLSQLCIKAGLAAKAWRKDQLEVETYQVQYFEESH